MEIKTEWVKEGLQKMLGFDPQVFDWKTEDFTKVGDNYATIVTSIKSTLIRDENIELAMMKNRDQFVSVNISNEDSKEDKVVVTFIAKYLPRRGQGPFQKILMLCHETECIFLETIAPRLNSVIESLNMKPLVLPKCFFSNNEPGNEILINEDMRKHKATLKYYRRT